MRNRERKTLPYMPLNQPFIYQAKIRKLSSLLGFSLRSFLPHRIPWLANLLYELHVGERLVEYPFVLMNIPEGQGLKVLDVGCCGSAIPIELASLGYKVWGIDVRPYPLEHPNFTFVQGDICYTSFPDNFFDVVTVVSTIEHIGMERYGDPSHTDGDKKSIAEIRRILGVNGQLIMTVPFAKKYHVVVPQGREYDLPSLMDLLSRFRIVKTQYGVRKEGDWVSASLEKAEAAPWGGKTTTAVALVVAEKETE